ncbi:G-protein coupled receptors family 1 profile domain-containing protein [Caenorhabditis elegans]|uniref:G-protein coupled receptors family 1 profile domain-containing protein n=1 Tax=Caenorhabditis elegans TaxID=6239 RepID=O16980_CAEEL|nr:G-protein coupled receptors family 1 profile domain-containing protein [Caenorhabditis elegans]CCD71813.2 G-protein coupled receptors family 1 profile domain-containing protein [Caenorhabditis elegans]|eukprot:NP_503766.3 Serpentine Receptor, class W [Caenorhabditis elegans]
MANITDFELFFNETTTAKPPKEIVKYVEIPSWFDEVFLKFNYVIAILQFFAVAINLIHLSVLTRKELRAISIYRIMIVICILDIISEILSFISFSPFWIRETLEGQECYVTVTYRDALIDQYGVPVLDMTQRGSSWLNLFMALLRVLAITYPMSSAIEKPVIVPVFVLISLIFNGICSICVTWNFEVTQQYMDFSCDGTQNLLPANASRYIRTVPVGKKELHSTLVFIYGIIKALPSLVEPILAVILIMELKRASQRRKTMLKSDGKGENTTKLILFMTISSFLLEVPNGFSHFAFGFFTTSPLIKTASYLIMVFAEIFPVTNSSTHLFVCFFMSTLYRETAISMMGISKQKITKVEEVRQTSVARSTMTKTA